MATIAVVRGEAIADDEDLVLEVRPHWSVLVAPILLALALVALALVGAVELRPRASWERAGVLVLAVVGVAIVLHRIALRNATRVILTSRRLVLRSGTFTRRVREVPLDRVVDMSSVQRLHERIVGRGSVIVETAGRNGLLELRRVPDPEGLQGSLWAQVERRKPWAGAPDSSATLLGRLEALARSGALTPGELAAIRLRMGADASAATALGHQGATALGHQGATGRVPSSGLP